MVGNPGATIFCYQVANPTDFGVVTLDTNGQPVAIEEKPAKPRSQLAVTGLYIYGSDVIDIAARAFPSAREELEITDLNREFLQQKRLRVRYLGRGTAWLDGGKPNDLYEASQLVKVIQDRTGLRIACPEELAYRLGFIDVAALVVLSEQMPVSDYRNYLLSVLKER